jgi:predicted transcriptional regulator
MEVAWRRGVVTVQEVADALNAHRKLAYTTVMTVMSRLAEKGMLTRRKDGRAYVYVPAASRDSVATSMTRAFVDRLYAGSASDAIAHLIESEATVGDEELDRLEALIRARRKAQR